ncbi:MAG: outer membrane beta-barrel protein, partial [Asticcacaulis sp.]|nr:outer membrane beta-barrel protein [Asticcacaulis sp.]
MVGFRFRLLAGTAVALTGVTCASGALADTALGWYVAADAGHGPISSQSLSVSDVTLTSTPPGATPPLSDGDYKLTPDYNGRGFVRAGYRFTPNLRAELELGARPGNLTHGLDDNTDVSDLGNFDKTSLMGNLIFDVFPGAPVHPYVGVGAGMVQVNADYREPVIRNGHDLVYSLQADKTVPAAQILAGATIDVTKHLHFDMTYRYLRTGSTSYDIAVSDTHGGMTDTYTAKGEGPIEDHSITVGFRWTFGASRAARGDQTTYTPPPAAKPVAQATKAPAATLPAARPTAPAVTTAPIAPVAAQPPARQYAAATNDDTSDNTGDDTSDGTATAAVLTTPAPSPRHYTAYFPFGGARLDSNARSVIVDAAQYAQSAPQAWVQVDGYA